MPELADFKSWFRKSRDHLSDWRQEAKEDYGFVSGDQWSEEDKAILEEQLRPCITFNRVGPMIDAVVGSEIQNRQEVRYIPRQIGDAAVNEMLTEAARWFRDQSEAEDEETEAFLDMVTCGLGWTETRLDYESNPDGEPIVERVDPFEMYYDPLARKRNIADSKYRIRVKDIAIADAKEMFPDAKDGTLHASWAVSASEADNLKEPQVAEDAQFYADEAKDRDPFIERTKVRIVEVQWWERETYYRVADPSTGQAAELTPDEHKKLTERATAIGLEIKGVKQQRRVYWKAFIGAEELDRERMKADSFTYKCMTGKRDHNKRTFYGIVRMMKDPQRWANKWLSQMLHIINSNAKGGLMAERGAFDNIQKAEESWANPQAITWMRDGALVNGKIKEKSQAQFPAGMFQLTEFAITSIRDATGINLELLGLKNTEQAGVLEAQRKQAGMTILATLFDSLRRYRKEQGKLMLYYITHYLSDGRLIRIVGDEGAKYVPLIHDPAVTEYDIIVDDSPTSPNQKEQVFSSLMQLFPTLSKMPIPPQVWGELLKYSPLPESLTTKIGELIGQPQGQQGQQGPSPEQLQQQTDMQQHQAEMQLEQQKVQQQTAMEAHKTGATADLEWRKAVLQAATQIEVARIAANTDMNSTQFEASLQHLLGIQQIEKDKHIAAMTANTGMMENG